MTVKLASGTAARGGQVYARVTADTGKNVGDIEAADDTGKTVAVSGCTFMGPADADGNTEIAYNIGFSDPSNFSRTCTRWFGVSPAVYRRRIRQLQT